VIAGAGHAGLSSAQQRLFAEENLYSTGAAYTVASGLRLLGDLDTDALRVALAAVADRHEPLRTSFELVDGQAVQVVHDRIDCDWHHVDLHGRSTEAWRLLTEAQDKPFDLAQAPLWRALLLTVDDREHWFLLTLHHIVVDGWGMSVLWRDISVAYQAARSGGPPLKPLPLSYTEFTARQRESLQGKELDRLLAYWRRQLAGPLPEPALPLDRPRPPVRDYSGACHHFTLPAELVQGVRGLASRNRTTTFVALLSVFACLLSRFSGDDDVIVGVPLANRHWPQAADLVGYLVNPLPLRLRVRTDETVDELARQARRVILEAMAHQELPFDRLIREVAPRRDLSAHPLFQAMFSVQAIPESDVDFPGVAAAALDLPDGSTAGLDLNVLFHETGPGITGFIEYRSEIFDAATIERLAGNLVSLLADAVRPGARIAGLRMAEPGGQSRPAAPADLVHRLIERHADRTPDAIAVRQGTDRMTYGELEAKSNQVAWMLLRDKGVGPGCVVGVVLPRGIETIVTLVGVLKAGGAYLPIDPSFPDGRIRQIVDDAKPAVVLREVPPYRDWPEERPDVPMRPENLAYVTYTSGSTGRPKGVMITHANVTNFVSPTQPMSPSPNDTVGLHSSPAFDASVYELWSTLCAGAQIVLPASRDRLDPADYHQLATEASALLLTPGLFAALADHDRSALSRVRHLNLGGDQLDADRVERTRDADLVTLNCYGPTECTVAATAGLALRRTPFGRVPIGHPLDGVQVYVLDRWLRPVPLGAQGELYIGGAGVARGYIGNPALTAERFVASPFRPGARLYRTGDIVRRLAPDGALEFLGRGDDQVKLRGFRIEPGEVEAVLRAHETVRSAVVVVHHAAEPELVGYVAPAGARRPRREELLDHLRDRLPAYMVPATVVVLDELPLTTSGKVDRTRLPQPPPAHHSAPGTAFTPAQEQIAAVWREMLDVEHHDIGLDDDFFEIGGDSLIALRVVAELTEQGIPISVRDLYRLATVRACAEFAEGG
jgi:amino acid adenylation domain-containing protein